MFKPVAMTRLRLVILERDERAVLRQLGHAGVIQLTRTPAGPDTAPLSPRDRSAELARLERLSSRLENFRPFLGIAARPKRIDAGGNVPGAGGETIQPLEEQSGELIQRRQHLQQRLAEMTAVNEQISDYRGLELPLDQPDESSFLHFVTGSLPAENFAKLEIGDDVALLPLAEHDGRQIADCHDHPPKPARIGSRAATSRFSSRKYLPVVAGATTATLTEQNQREQEQAAAELKELNAKLQTLAEKFAPLWAQIEAVANIERRLLEAEQNFPRTESRRARHRLGSQR